MSHRAVTTVFVVFLVCNLLVLAASNLTKSIVFTPEINAFYAKLPAYLSPVDKYQKIAAKFPELLCDEKIECERISEWVRSKEFVENFDFRVITSMSVTSALLLVILVSAFAHLFASRRIPSYTKQKYRTLLVAVRRAAAIQRSSKVSEAEKTELQTLLKQLFEAQHAELLRGDEHKKAFPLDFDLDPKLSQEEQLKRVLRGDPKNAPVRIEIAEGAREDSR